MFKRIATRHHFCGLLALLLIFQATLPVFGYPFQGQQAKAFTFSICDSSKQVTVYLTQSSPHEPDNKHQAHCPLCLLPAYGDSPLSNARLTLSQRQENHLFERPAITKNTLSTVIAPSYLIRAPPFLDT